MTEERKNEKSKKRFPDATAYESVQHLLSLRARRHRSKWIVGVSLILAIITFLVLIALPSYLRAREKAKEWEAKSSFEIIRTALERYTIVNRKCIYPHDIQSLIDEGYLNPLPINPFTRVPISRDRFWLRPFEGELTYMPISKNGQVCYFYMVGYGSRKTKGMALDGFREMDHVDIIVESECGCEPSTYHPDLKGLLNGSKSTVEPDNPE